MLESQLRFHEAIFKALLCEEEQCANRARLRVVIRDLRKKLEPDPAKPRYLLTDSHVGYRFGPEQFRLFR